MDSPSRRRSWVCLGLGSNLGDKQRNLELALTWLKEEVTFDRVSSFYETDPVGFEDQPAFVNAAASGSTDLSPDRLLTFIKGVERDAGRVPTVVNGPRVLDIDILLFGVGTPPSGAVVTRTPDLTIPHPRMHERAFVLVPLTEIEPLLTHPVLERNMRDLAREIGSEGVRKLP
jgi:2-amino-4-hydroxy-6-hydroxymethyldihydropteridine diphosphokinase